MVRLGYNSNGFPHHRLDQALEWLAELGYQAVAITPDVPHLDPANTGDDEVARIGALCRKLGLQPVLETGARFVLDPRRKHRPNLLETSASERAVRQDHLRRMLDWAAALGAPALSLWSGALPAGQDPERADALLGAALQDLAEHGAAAGVTVALEPEPGHHVATLADFDRLQERFGNAWRLCLDVGHLLDAGEAPPHQVVAERAAQIAVLQLDDMRRGVHDHLAPGEGDLDWPALARAVRGQVLDVPACFELSRDGHRFHQLAPAAIRFWRSLA